MPLITLKIAATDDASKVLDKVQRKLADMNNQTSGGKGGAGTDIDIKGLDSLAGKFSDVLSGGGLATLGIGAGVAALGAMGMAMAETGAKAQALEASFGSMASAAGQSSASMLAAMQQASGGTIANTELMLRANQAMAFGVADTSNEMVSLMQVAISRGAKVGLSASEAFGRIVEGVGKLSAEMLDELGIVGLAASYEKYAKSVGKPVDALTELEKKQALVNAVIASTPNAAAEAAAAAENNASAWARWDANIQNLGNSMGKLLSGPGADLIDWLNAPVDGLNRALDPAPADMLAARIENVKIELMQMNESIGDTQAKWKGLEGVDPAFLPPDMQSSSVEDDLAQVDALREAVAKRNEELRALLILQNTLANAGSVDASVQSTGQAQAQAWMAEQAAIVDQTRATVAEIIANADAAQSTMLQTYTAQLDSLTKGLINDIGAGAALEMNGQLKQELAALIALYQQLGMSSAQIDYSIIQWMNDQAAAARNAITSLNNLSVAETGVSTAARDAAGGLSVYAHSAVNAATISARSIAPLRAMAGALNAVAMAAAAGGGPSRMDKWERLNYDLTGITPKAYAMRDGMDALAGAFDSAAYSAGSFGGAAAASVDDGIAGKVQSLLSGSLSVDVGVDTSAYLPREDALNEDARRLADVMVNGFSSPWASYFESTFPALFAEMTAGGDIQAGAAALLQQFEAGLRPELINQEAVKERVKAMLVGDANMAALASEITADLQAELAGMDPAQVASMVNGALGIQETGVGAGIEDELGNAALIGKIQGTGTTAGKSWGQAFLAYVENNVPATLVGLLVDLVTPGVRAKIAEESSAGGAL